jgi:hypothetical protein
MQDGRAQAALTGLPPLAGPGGHSVTEAPLLARRLR